MSYQTGLSPEGVIDFYLANVVHNNNYMNKDKVAAYVCYARHCPGVGYFNEACTSCQVVMCFEELMYDEWVRARKPKNAVPEFAKRKQRRDVKRKREPTTAVRAKRTQSDGVKRKRSSEVC